MPSAGCSSWPTTPTATASTAASRSGEKCGAAAANAYCKTQAFAEASTYHKVDRNDITGGPTASDAQGCQNNTCNVVAIVCTR